jgi:hypothetical protein
MESHQKELKIKVPYGTLKIPLLSIDPKEIQSLSQRDICIPMFILALFMAT